MKIILIIILFGALSLLTRNFSGEGGGITKGDERQKQIYRDSAIVSWQTLLFYALLRLLTIIPLFNQLSVNEKSSILLSNPIFRNGGDILVVGLLGYVIGFLGSYLKRSKTDNKNFV